LLLLGYYLIFELLCIDGQKRLLSEANHTVKKACDIAIGAESVDKAFRERNKGNLSHPAGTEATPSGKTIKPLNADLLRQFVTTAESRDTLLKLVIVEVVVVFSISQLVAVSVS